MSSSTRPNSTRPRGTQLEPTACRTSIGHLGQNPTVVSQLLAFVCGCWDEDTLRYLPRLQIPRNFEDELPAESARRASFDSPTDRDTQCGGEDHRLVTPVTTTGAKLASGRSPLPGEDSEIVAKRRASSAEQSSAQPADDRAGEDGGAPPPRAVVPFAATPPVPVRDRRRRARTTAMRAAVFDGVPRRRQQMWDGCRALVVWAPRPPWERDGNGGQGERPWTYTQPRH